jgi:hypothetical protein
MTDVHFVPSDEMFLEVGHKTIVPCESVDTVQRFTYREVLGINCSLGTATRLRDGRSGFLVLISRGSWEFFFSPQYPNGLWGPPSLLSNGYMGIFPEDKAAGA